MRLKKILGTAVFAAAMAVIVSVTTSCKTDDGGTETDLGKITGIVTDQTDAPLAGVTVTVTGLDGSATTAADGTYTIENVPIARQTVNFSKTGYQSATVTVQARGFTNNTATANAILVDASAKIVGTVKDGKNAGAALAGVTVSAGSNMTATTADDGTYAIEGIALTDYTLTFTKADYPTVTKEVKKADFVDGTATVDAVLGEGPILGDMTASALKDNATAWYYNEYKGGRNAQNYPQWDWAVDFLAALDFYGAWEEGNWGTEIKVRNDAVTGDTDNPADTDNLDSFVWGKKTITADNKILSVRASTGDINNETEWGVKVVDLSEEVPSAKKVGANQKFATAYPENDKDLDNQKDFHFDLSDYVGKEVVIAIGVYRAATGDYSRTLALRRIAFTKENLTGLDWISGTEVSGLENWKLPAETIKSTMINPNNSFAGVNPVGLNRDNYQAGYQAWRAVKHVGVEWCFVPLKKDPETAASEGFLIKTNSSAAIDLNTPESYIYVKKAITADNNKMTLRARNFGDHFSFVKLTAIDDSALTVSNVQPTWGEGITAELVGDNCFKFKHGNGNGEGDGDNYAAFEFDLSALNGKNVVLVFSIHKGESNGDENKLVIYGVDFHN